MRAALGAVRTGVNGLDHSAPWRQKTGVSKSLKRVRRALSEAGLSDEVVETPLARTARDAATAVRCEVDQIAKSIIFADADGVAVLFLTAGGNQVDQAKAARVAGGPLGKADAALVRSQTGFAIGGVAPVGHLSPIRAWIDPRLLEFDSVWAAAGTPHHVFSINPHVLADMAGAIPADFTSDVA